MRSGKRIEPIRWSRCRGRKQWRASSNWPDGLTCTSFPFRRRHRGEGAFPAGRCEADSPLRTIRTKSPLGYCSTGYLDTRIQVSSIREMLRTLVFCFSSRRTEVRPSPAGLEKPQPEQKNSSESPHFACGCRQFHCLTGISSESFSEVEKPQECRSMCGWTSGNPAERPPWPADRSPIDA